MSQGVTNKGKSVEHSRGYVIHEWSGPSVDSGEMKKFSVSPSGSFHRKAFDTIEQARAYVAVAPTLRKIRVEFECYVPEFDIPDRPPLNIPEPFALTPPPEVDPVVCAQCGEDIHLEQGVWVDSTGGDGCEDDVHSPYARATEDQIDEWIRFELGGGSIAGDNPLTKHGLDVTDVLSIDIEVVR